MESTLPSGETDVLHYPGYKRSEEHGWVYGNHPKATEQQNAHFQDTLISINHVLLIVWRTYQDIMDQ